MKLTGTSRKLQQPTKQLLLILVLAASYAFLRQLSFVYPPNADNASAMLAGEDLLHGNWILRYWALSEDPYWLTDLPFYAIGIWVRGVSPVLLHEIPTAIYLGLVVVVVLAVLAPIRDLDTERHPAWIALAAALMPLVFPAAVLGGVVLRGPYHIATIGCVLGTFVLIHRAMLEDDRGRRVVFVIPAVGVLAAAAMSDPFAVWIGVVPAMLTSLALVYPHRRHVLSTSCFIPGAVGIAAWLAAKAIYLGLRAMDGMVLIAAVPHQFADIQRVGANVFFLFEGLLQIFGAYFVEMRPTVGLLPVLVRLCGCLVAITALVFAVKDARRLGNPLSSLLGMSSFVLTSAFLFSAVPYRSAAPRYLVPLLVFGSVALGRRVRAIGLVTKPSLSLIVLLAASLVAGVYALDPLAMLRFSASHRIVTTPRENWPSMTILGSWLTARGFREGYGTYWSASTVTVATGGAVVVRPVKMLGGRIIPNLWNIKCTWFLSGKRNFLVLLQNDPDVPSIPDFLAAVGRTFGPPAVSEVVGIHWILEWDHPIHTDLQARNVGRLRTAAEWGFARLFHHPPAPNEC